jgi:hypothetical protein
VEEHAGAISRGYCLHEGPLYGVAPSAVVKKYPGYLRREERAAALEKPSEVTIDFCKRGIHIQ